MSVVVLGTAVQNGYSYYSKHYNKGLRKCWDESLILDKCRLFLTPVSLNCRGWVKHNLLHVQLNQPLFAGLCNPSVSVLGSDVPHVRIRNSSAFERIPGISLSV